MTTEQGKLGVKKTGSESEGASARSAGWVIRATREARHCINPIRTCVEEFFTEALEQRNPDKELIKLSIGEFCSVYL